MSAVHHAKIGFIAALSILAGAGADELGAAGDPAARHDHTVLRPLRGLGQQRGRERRGGAQRHRQPDHRAVLGGGASCDIGPPYTGAIPAAAAQAGFTRCAANYDFTYAGSFTDSVGTHQWSNLSSWFSCSESNSAPYLIYYADGTEGSNVGCDTNHYNITTDSGVQVFATTYYQTDANAGHYSSALATQGSNTGAVVNLGDEYYIEAVMRPSNTSPYTTQITYSALSTFTKVQGNPCFFGTDMEWDSGKLGTGVGQSWWNPTCGTSGGWGGTCGTGNCATPSSSDGTINASVNTWGNLTTGDGVSRAASCNYWSSGSVNGLPASAFKSCFSNTIVPPMNSTAVFHNAPMYMYFETGPHRNVITMAVPSVTTYWQRITVWECPGYATGACINNPVITTHP
jgi:hypothetical protein